MGVLSTIKRASRSGPAAGLRSGHVALVLLFSAVFHRDVKERDVFSWMDPYPYYDFAARNLYWIGGYQQILRLGRVELPRRLVR